MTKKKLLWIGWDGADWEHITPMLDAGELPHLERLVNSGVMGNLATHHPILSPMLWNTAATGKQPNKHGILGFVEPDRANGGARPFQSTSRTTKAIWNILSQNGLRSNVINWWASHPAEPIEGCVVSNMITGIKYDQGKGWKCASGTVHPPELAQQVLPYKVFGEEMTGDEILPFVPDGQKICQDEDPRLSMVATHLADMVSTQGIATAVMEKSDWDFMAVYFTAIDHFCHSFMSYYPPRLPWVGESDFQMYRHVIGAAYRLSDAMLGRMMELAGPDTTILLCSDHGFQSGPLRLHTTPNEPSGPAHWHRQYGIFVASGPGIKRDERVYSASLVDICPTILSLFDLPVGQDMDGRVLTEIYEVPPAINSIPSWDDVDGNGKSGMHTADVASAPEEAEELFNQFVALGYVESPGDSSEENFEMAEIECQFNLARSLNSQGLHSEACPIFIALVNKSPWESRFILHLARTLIAVQRLKQAESLLASAYDLETTEDLTVRLFIAEIRVMQGDRAGSFAQLKTIEQFPYASPAILMSVGNCLIQIQRLKEAERVLRRVLQIHPDHAGALEALSTVLVRRGENQEAADTALAAVSLLHRLPRAHLNLGIALARGGDPSSAVIAFENSLRFAPAMINGHRWLQLIYTSMLPDSEKAALHRAKASELMARRMNEKVEIASPSFADNQLTLSLPIFPSEREREVILAKNRPNTLAKFGKSGKQFVLVSGLPRSGTSVMMQMLEAGGMSSKTDGARVADIDNPRGYHEWEDVKKLGTSPELFDENGLERFCIKVVSPLLSQLPYQHHYKVIFMNRPVEEVAASQSKMIDRLNTFGANMSHEQLCVELESHRAAAIEWLRMHPRAEVLVVDYVGLLESPDTWIDQIVSFVGSERVPRASEMKSVIQSSLRRNRSSR